MLVRNTLFILLAVAFLVGCDSPRWIEVKQPPEAPVANIPRALRYKNWADARGSGSCVIASSCSCFVWANRPDLATKFRQSYAGGQTARSIIEKYNANNVPAVYPKRDSEYGDPDFLEWASRTRRPAIIWYFPNHCVTFCGFGRYQNTEVAWLLDNNRTQQFIPIPKTQFIQEWRRYGGFCAIPLFTPAPCLPFPGYEVRL